MTCSFSKIKKYSRAEAEELSEFMNASSTLPKNRM